MNTWIAVILGWLSPALGRARHFLAALPGAEQKLYFLSQPHLLESCTWDFPHTPGLCLQGEVIGEVAGFGS